MALLVWSTLAVGAFAVALRVGSRPGSLPLLPRAAPRGVAVLAWVELGAPRPRAAPLVGRHGRRARRSSLAFPYTRFIGEPAKSDTLGLIPLWTFNEHLLGGSYRDVIVAAVGGGARHVLLLVPARRLAVPVVLLGLFACSRGPSGRLARVSRAGEGRSSRGSAASPRLDRPRRPRRRRGRRALDGPRRPLHGEHERVLQPARRARSSTPTSRRPAGSARQPCASTRTTGRCGARRRAAAGDGSVRAARRVDRPRRRARRARRGRRHGALAAARARSRRGRRSPASTRRHVVGRAGHVAPPPLRGRQADGDRAQRPVAHHPRPDARARHRLGAAAGRLRARPADGPAGLPRPAEPDGRGPARSIMRRRRRRTRPR